MLALHLAFLALVVGTAAFFSWLDVVNVRYGERLLAERADWVRDRFEVDDPDEIAAYDRARTGVGLLETATTTTLLLVVLYSGLFADAVAALESTGLPPLARGATLFVGAVVAAQLVSRPFDAYRTFVVEELFEFNEQTPGLFVRDTLVQLVVGGVLVGALGTALLAVVRTVPDLWAIGGAVLFLGFQLVMQIVYPRVIAPLFNDFEPIEAGELREAVEDVFDRAGFECEQLYEMDASRRSSKSNAYFVGFGRTKRVVLFDTLVEQMSIEEVQAVLAHELAHWKQNHVWKGMAAGTVEIAVLLGIAQWLIGQPWLTGMFGVPGGATYAALALALLWVAPVSQLLAPVSNRLSLRFERAADDFGAAVVDAGTMASSLSTLGGENLANPFPHPLYETFHYDHPPIPERIRRLEDREGGASDAGGDEGATPA
ncbi:MAG: M48 family metallopeptidase [Halovenus sp.]